MAKPVTSRVTLTVRNVTGLRHCSKIKNDYINNDIKQAIATQSVMNCCDCVICC